MINTPWKCQTSSATAPSPTGELVIRIYQKLVTFYIFKQILSISKHFQVKYIAIDMGVDFSVVLLLLGGWWIAPIAKNRGEIDTSGYRKHIAHNNFQYAVEIWRHTGRHTRTSSVLVHTLGAYTRILHSCNTGLCHNSKVCEPNLRVRHDSGGVYGTPNGTYIEKLCLQSFSCR